MERRDWLGGKEEKRAALDGKDFCGGFHSVFGDCIGELPNWHQGHERCFRDADEGASSKRVLFIGADDEFACQWRLPYGGWEAV